MTETRLAIEAMGQELNPDVLMRGRSLFEEEQVQIAASLPALALDVPYGPHERHRLDIYRDAQADNSLVPVILFVHGGGFVRGDKGGDADWMNANVGRLAARWGCLGVVMNYRLAPDHSWPAGSEDIETAIQWMKDNIARFGGNPEKIVLMGTSAGAVHVAGYIRLAGEEADNDIRGAVLLSGLYGYTPLDERDTLYYGSQDSYENRVPRDAILSTGVPLFVCCAEYDPPRFQKEFLGLMTERLEQYGSMYRGAIAADHNHYTLSLHLGTSDNKFSTSIEEFIREACA